MSCLTNEVAVALHGPKPGGMVLFVGLHRAQRLLNSAPASLRLQQSPLRTVDFILLALVALSR